MNAEVVSVTPELAAEWLSANIGNNRKISKRTVSRYASEMASGRWLLTGEAIQFDLNGRLINGQHRLSAVVESKATVQLLVIKGLGEEAVMVLDTGRVRSASDALEVAGLSPNSNQTAALARRIMALQSGNANVLAGRGGLKISGKPITNRDIVEFCRKNDLSEHLGFSRSVMFNQVTNALNQGEYAFFHWFLGRVDASDADVFLSQIAMLENVGQKSPVRTLVIKLTKSVALDGKQKFHAVAIAWNAWRKGEECAAIYVGRLDSGPEIPEVI